MGCNCGKNSSSPTPTTQPKQIVKRTPLSPSKRIIKRTAR